MTIKVWWQRPPILIALIATVASFLTAMTNERRNFLPATSTLESQSEFVRQIPIATNDVVYSSSTEKIYVSVPSSAGGTGNSIATIDPVTGTITNSVFVGSEPNQLALSDNGHTLYTSLDGSFAIRSFDVATQVPGQQFTLGQDRLYTVSDLAVAPGNPNLVAVTRFQNPGSPSGGGVAVFDNGVQRPETVTGTLGTGFLAFSDSVTTLYGAGGSNSLTRMTIGSSGVTVSGATSFFVGQIEFANGRIYDSGGKVVDPDAGTLLGTFPGASSAAFVIDTSVGRAYYAVGGTTSGLATITVKAFDINTLLPVGSFDIAGVSGYPTSMVRWGSNGLSFRTTAGQLYLIQTSLIPSADPIPSPTPTPSPSPSPSSTPFETFVQQISLKTNDLIFSPATQKLYASVPSSQGTNGNSIQEINPVTAALGPAVFVGSEPTRLASSVDGQVIYAALDGAGAVRRFDPVSQTAGIQFPLGNDSFDGVLFADDISVMPGSPETVAVSTNNRVSSGSNGVGIYDDGIKRPQVGNTASRDVEFSDLPTTLYSSGSEGAAQLTVGASGVLSKERLVVPGTGRLRFDAGVLYTSSGSATNPDTGTQLGAFVIPDCCLTTRIMTTDSNLGRAFFLTAQGSGSTLLRAYDLNTFLPLGVVNLQGVAGDATSLVRWGTNGLAFRTTANQVFIIQSTLVSGAGSVPTPTPTPSPTPSPSPEYVPTFVRRVDLPANAIVYSDFTQSLYASVPSAVGADGNSLTRIDPVSGTIGTSVFIGSEPGKLAVSDDGTTIYTFLAGANAIRRFDLPAEIPGPQFASSPRPVDMDVLPGTPQSLAVSRGVNAGVVIYDNGVQRPNAGSGSSNPVGPIEFNTTTTLYGYNNFTTACELVKFAVDNSGLSTISSTSNLLTGFVTGLKFANGRLYSGSGKVADPELNHLVGTFTGVNSNAVLDVDPGLGRAFYAYSSASNVIVAAYDINTFLPIGSVILPNIPGIPVNLVRWGTNGLAFNTVAQFPPYELTDSRIYLLQSQLVSSASPIPTGVQLLNDEYFVTEASSSASIIVKRSGDVTQTTTVDFATSDVTATAGVDYTATSGTLTFAPGQLTRTISVPVFNDNLYEGSNETFNITLSNVSGNAILTSPSAAVVTIQENDQKPTMSFSGSPSVIEGNSSTTNLNFTVVLSNPSVQTITVDYTTMDGTAVAGSDYVATSGSLSFTPGTTSKTVTVVVNGDTIDEPDEVFSLVLSNATNIIYLSQSFSDATIVDDDGPPKLRFESPTIQVSEGVNAATITVMLLGVAVDPVSVDYLTTDQTARQTRDYTIASGTLNFAAGESTKTFSVLITDDGYAEANETLLLSLSNPKGDGASLGSPATATLRIVDNDSVPAPTNPLDTPEFFVRQHYSDFLSREPDPGGLAFWTDRITSCPAGDIACTRTRRVEVSNAFFYELEYQQTGSYVFRLYRAAYGDSQPFPNPDMGQPVERLKIPSYQSFVVDRSRVVAGVSLAQSQLALANSFVLQPEFQTRYPASYDGPAFVDAILGTIRSSSGVDLGSQRTALIDLFNTGGRGEVLYRLCDDNLQSNPIGNRAFIDAEYNRAFVFTQYAGYLRRDADVAGLLFWLDKVNQFPVRNADIQHTMVCAFITSSEYQTRLSPIVTHNNSECGP